MSKQQDNPRPSVAVPVLIALIALAAFGYAFYAFDGVAIVSDLLGLSAEGSATERTPGAVTAEPSELQLPPGMAEEFALRLWQEQIDSQANIKRLVEGDITRIVIDDVAQGSDVATLSITAEFEDGTSAPGHMGMRKFGDVWYFEYVTGMRQGETGGLADDTSAGTGEPPTGALPELADVDIPLLNTILQQQASSAAVLEEYATGVVADVRIDEVVPGTGNTTLKLVMNEDHEQGYGEIVVVSKEIDGEPTWFIARFTKVAAE